MKAIEQLIFSLGIRSTYKGFRYLRYALYLCLLEEDYLLSVYKDLYVAVAEYFGVSRDNVERCIRTLVSACWYKGNRNLLIEMSGCETLDKPVNSEFIDILYHYLKDHNVKVSAGDIEQ